MFQESQAVQCSWSINLGGVETIEAGEVGRARCKKRSSYLIRVLGLYTPGCGDPPKAFEGIVNS